MKNRFMEPTFLGYRDVLVLLRFEHGAGSFVCELGLHLRPLRGFGVLSRCLSVAVRLWSCGRRPLSPSLVR